MNQCIQLPHWFFTKIAGPEDHYTLPFLCIAGLLPQHECFARTRRWHTERVHPDNNYIMEGKHRDTDLSLSVYTDFHLLRLQLWIVLNHLSRKQMAVKPDKLFCTAKICLSLIYTYIYIQSLRERSPGPRDPELKERICVLGWVWCPSWSGQTMQVSKLCGLCAWWPPLAINFSGFNQIFFWAHESCMHVQPGLDFEHRPLCQGFHLLHILLPHQLLLVSPTLVEVLLRLHMGQPTPRS